MVPIAPLSLPVYIAFLQLGCIHPDSLFFFQSFCLFRAAPMAYGVSQARDEIRAVAASLYHSNARHEPRLLPTPQLTSMPDP